MKILVRLQTTHSEKQKSNKNYPFGICDAMQISHFFSHLQTKSKKKKKEKYYVVHSIVVRLLCCGWLSIYCCCCCCWRKFPFAAFTSTIIDFCFVVVLPFIWHFPIQNDTGSIWIAFFLIDNFSHAIYSWALKSQMEWQIVQFIDDCLIGCPFLLSLSFSSALSHSDRCKRK